jgi:hypothetical protein
MRVCRDRLPGLDPHERSRSASQRRHRQRAGARRPAGGGDRVERRRNARARRARPQRAGRRALDLVQVDRAPRRRGHPDHHWLRPPVRGARGQCDDDGDLLRGQPVHAHRGQPVQAHRSRPALSRFRGTHVLDRGRLFRRRRTRPGYLLAPRSDARQRRLRKRHAPDRVPRYGQTNVRIDERRRGRCDRRARRARTCRSDRVGLPVVQLDGPFYWARVGTAVRAVRHPGDLHGRPLGRPLASCGRPERRKCLRRPFRHDRARQRVAGGDIPDRSPPRIRRASTTCRRSR